MSRASQVITVETTSDNVVCQNNYEIIGHNFNGNYSISYIFLKL